MPADTSYGQMLEEEKEKENNSDVVRDEELDSNETIDEDFMEEEGIKLNTTKRMIVVKPHQKRKVICSQSQALTHLSWGMTQMIESHSKTYNAIIEFERERNCEFKRLEAAKT